MAQCERMLANGERCSNQASPGNPFCTAHERIKFKLTARRADTAPPSAPKVKQRNWQAHPSAVGQEPAFPGLRADGRNILVAPQGFIWLQAERPDPLLQFQRLVHLLGFLSQSFALPGQIRIRFQADGALYILHLIPDNENLSVFYDAVADATKLVNGQLYIGQDNTFVQYRDDSAPRGYDVPKFQAPTNQEEILLVAHWGSRVLLLSNFTELSLRELYLRISPLPATTGQALEQVYALVPTPLYPVLARYFHAHHLRYRLARLQISRSECILFEIRPRPDAPTGQMLPAFILDYLSRLPYVVLLVQAYQTGNLSILLHWKFRYPLHLPNIAAAFAPDDMILLPGEHYPSVRVNPPPQFFDGDQLVDAHLPKEHILQQAQQTASPAPVLQLELLLRPDNGPVPPVAALILSTQERGWLRQLLYLLPGDAFSAFTFYQGQEFSILVSDNRPIEGLPFGLPLRRPGNRELFIPLRSRFVPDVPWLLLHEALDIQERVYTFLTPDGRIDLSKALFVPLSRTLMATPKRPRVKVNMLPPATLPELRWTAPPPEPPGEGPVRRNRLFGRPLPTPQEVPLRTAQDVRLEEDTLWREKARTCEKVNDFLGAAVCYNFLNDISNSARCYRRAVSELQVQRREGE